VVPTCIVALRDRDTLPLPHKTEAVSRLGLVGYWTFDENTGTTAEDFAGRVTNIEKNVLPPSQEYPLSVDIKIGTAVTADPRPPRRPAMAKREQRGNREKRKPKAEKPIPPPQTSSFSQQVGAATMKSGARKKAR
jgi:hypothetical protein